jgi:hypothetical protein
LTSQVLGVFGGQSDQTLEKIRGEIKRQLSKSRLISYEILADVKLPGNKTLKITNDDLFSIVEETRFGTPHAYFLLSLIYPTVDFKVRRYEVDHIHPKFRFNKSNLRELGVQEDLIEDWIDYKRDLLPNLQLLGAIDNNNKRSKSIIEYLRGKSRNDRNQFISENLLPKNLLPKTMEKLELENFDSFFEYRKRQLVKKLQRHFVVEDSL